MKRHFTCLAALLVTLLMAPGCANRTPEPIRVTPQPLVDIAAARRDVRAVDGQAVRWGGTIARVDNRPSETRLEIVERPLNHSGRPRETDTSGGRFLAVVSGFLDPAVFAVDREITVVGKLAGVLTLPVGAYPYQFPVVNVAQHHLWPLRPPARPVEHWPQPWPPFYYPPYPWPHRHTR